MRAFLPLAAIAIQHGALAATAVFTESKEVFRNPGQGWSAYVENWDKATNAVNVGVIYMRWPWAALEPEEGKYLFDAIERQMNFAVQRGVPYHFRVKCASKYGGRESETPQWVYDRGCRSFAFKPGRKWHYWKDGKKVEGGDMRAPYFDDPVFLEAHERFIRALAAKFDGDPRLMAVDLGSYGHYGEWHMWNFGIANGGEKLAASPEARRRIADMYTANFRKTRIVFMSDDVETLSYALGVDPVAPRVGLRRDGVGLPGRSDNWAGRGKFAAVPGMGDVWKNQLVCFEWGLQAAGMYKGHSPIIGQGHAEYDLPAGFDWIRENHGTTINTVPFSPWDVKADDSQTRAAMRRCDLFCGARLVPRTCVWERRGDRFGLDLKLENKGTSRIYLPYRLQLVIRDRAGSGIAAVSFSTDPGTWLPGEHRIRESAPLPIGLPDGATFALRLRHAGGKLMDFRFAVNESMPDRTIRLTP